MTVVYPSREEREGPLRVVDYEVESIDPVEPPHVVAVSFVLSRPATSFEADESRARARTTEFIAFELHTNDDTVRVHVHIDKVGDYVKGINDGLHVIEDAALTVEAERQRATNAAVNALQGIDFTKI